LTEIICRTNQLWRRIKSDPVLALIDSPDRVVGDFLRVSKLAFIVPPVAPGWWEFRPASDRKRPRG
jgi:hypothetical protein